MKQTLQNINGRMNHMNSVMKQSKDKLKDKLASASMALSGTAGEPDTIDLANNSNFQHFLDGQTENGCMRKLKEWYTKYNPFRIVEFDAPSKVEKEKLGVASKFAQTTTNHAAIENLGRESTAKEVEDNLFNLTDCDP